MQSLEQNSAASIDFCHGDQSARTPLTSLPSLEKQLAKSQINEMSKFENFQLELIIGGADTTRGWRPHEMLAESNSCMRRRGAQAAAVCLSRQCRVGREGELVSTTTVELQKASINNIQTRLCPPAAYCAAFLLSFSVSRSLQWTFKFLALSTMWVESTVQKKTKTLATSARLSTKFNLKKHIQSEQSGVLQSAPAPSCPHCPIVMIVPQGGEDAGNGVPGQMSHSKTFFLIATSTCYSALLFLLAVAIQLYLFLLFLTLGDRVYLL